MSERHKITFLMMAYNTEKYVERAVRSIMNQTLKDIVLVVRNNGSTDSTGEILKRLACEDNRIIVLENKVNCKLDDGTPIYEEGWWGFEIPETLSEYFSIVDSDDYIEQDFAKKMYDAATKANADITVCGHNFVNENEKRYSNRKPERKQIDSLSDFGNDFQKIYSYFRAWWAKLFKYDFFIEKYDKCWNLEKPMFWQMDTIIMLKYLMAAKNVVMIDDALYNMTVRNSSTYNIRPYDEGVLWNAYAVYKVTHRLLKNYNIDSDENIKFIKMIHWTYITEGLQRLKTEKISYREKINSIVCTLNDRCVGYYIDEMFEIIYGGLDNYLSDIEVQSNGDLSIYSSYLMRLKCFVDSAKVDDGNPLNYVMLIGALFAKDNNYQFGWKFAELPLKNISMGMEMHRFAGGEAWMYWAHNQKTFIERYVGYYDNNDEVRDLEKQVKYCYEKGDFDGCQEVAIHLLTKANLNRTALYYLIKVAKENMQYELSAILSYSVLNIYEYDDEMTELCRKCIMEIENCNGKL